MTEKIVSSSRPPLKELNFRKYRLVLRETSAGKTRLFFTNNGNSCFFFRNANFFLHLSFADFLKTWPSLSLGKGNASLKVILPSSSVSECLLEAHKPYTMLQKLSKCEVKAWLSWNLIILLPLRFYVKSNFGEFIRHKNVVFANFKGSEFLF